MGVNFWSRDFFGFVGSPRDFFGFDFCPHSIESLDHPRHLKSRVPPPPPPPGDTSQATCLAVAKATTKVTQGFSSLVYLTNMFHLAVRMYSDNAQMMSKRGIKEQRSTLRAAGEWCDFCSCFDVLCALYQSSNSLKYLRHLHASVVLNAKLNL